MIFDYGTILCPDPIRLSIGTLRQPTLRDIRNLSFDRFNLYEMFLKITPEIFYTKIQGEQGLDYWNSLSDNQRESITLYQMILEDEQLRSIYLEMLNFFFVEKVVFVEGLFVLMRKGHENDTGYTEESVEGVIQDSTFQQILELIQQICCIYEKESVDEIKFKNAKAKQYYKRMLNAEKAKKKRKKSDINLTLPNIISSVSNSHPTISPLNVWDLTIFVLLDSFRRMQNNAIYDINWTRVAVWGDEKKTFDASLWYKNNYDNKEDARFS